MPDWGSSQLELYYAGCRISVAGLSSNQHASLLDRYRELTAPTADCTAAVSTRVCRGEVPDEDASRYARNGIYMPQIDHEPDRIRIAGQSFRAQLKLAPSPSGELLTAAETALCQPAVFENFLRVVASYTSLQQGGLFMHSACIVFDGRAWLFLGRSGAGKSTLSRRALEAGLDIMSDDCNILRPAPQGGYQVSPVPFAGELGQVGLRAGHSVPLGGLFWLQQGDELCLEPMSAALQLARLLACAPVVNVDPHKLDCLTDSCSRILSRLPMSVLNFRRAENFARVRQLILDSNRATA